MPKPRRPFKFWALAAITALFTVFGLLLVVVGPSAANRLTGLASILFFGFGFLAYAGGPLLSRRGPGTVRLERITTSVGSEPAFVFPTPRAKQIVIAVATAGMAGGSVVLTLAIGASAVGIACTAIFGAFFLLSLWTLRRPQQLVLTPTRVMVDAAAGTVEVPWDAIADAEIYEMPAGRTTVDMIGVTATHRDAAIWIRGGRLGRLNRRMTAYDLTVGADTFAGTGEEVVDAIRRYRDDPGRRRHIGSEEELARLHRLQPLAGRT